MVNIGGSWLSEFERIALEKGWNISKEARFQGPLATKIQKDINAVAKRFRGFDPSVAKLRVEVDGDFSSLSKNALDTLINAIKSPEFAQLYSGSPYFVALQNLTSNEPQKWSDGLADILGLFISGGTPAELYVKKYQEQHEGVGDELPGKERKIPNVPALTKGMYPEVPALPEGMMPKKVDVPGKVKEHIFEPKKSSFIINKLISLANDLDNMGAEGAAIVVDKHLQTYKVAMNSLYNVMKETGEDLIEMAHPGGGPTIADAAEEGGKVETIVEENKKIINKMKKAPTGKIAETINKLVKKANDLEKAGHSAAARVVDKAIYELRKSVLPFVSRSSVCEATGSEDVKASVKIAVDQKAQLAQNIKMLMIKLAKIEGLIDSYGDSANKMRKLFNDVKSAYGQIASNYANLSLYDFAQKVAQLASFITTTDINVEDAFGSLDASSFWEVDRFARELINQFKKIQPTKEAPQKAISFEQRLKNHYLKILQNLINKFNETDPIRLSKLFGGSGKANFISKWLNEEKDKITNQGEDAEYYTGAIDWLNKNIAQILGIKIAKKEFNIKKEATTFIPPFGAKVVEKPVKRSPSIIRTKDQDVENLQTALIRLGIKIPGKNPTDGFWGTNTYNAYNDLRNMVKGIAKRDVLPAAPGERQAPAKNVLDKAIQIANYLADRQKSSVQGDVEIVPGKTIPGEAFNSVNSFISQLKLNKIIEESDHTDDIASQAFDVLVNFYQRYKNDDQFQQQLFINHQQEGINKIFKAVNKLAQELSQLKKQPAKKQEKQEKIEVREKTQKTSAEDFFQFLKFDPNNLRSVLSAINALDPYRVSDYKSFLRWGPEGVRENPRLYMSLYQRQLSKLGRALDNFRTDIEQQLGSKTFDKYVSKIDYFGRALDTAERGM